MDPINKMEAEDLTIEDLFITEETKRLNYSTNNYSKNNLIGWRSRNHALGLILFLTIYGNRKDSSVLIYSSSNNFVNGVAPMFPNYTFYVKGAKLDPRHENIIYQGPDFTVEDLDFYSSMAGLLIFVNLNRSDYWDKRQEEFSKRSLTEEDINDTSKYFLVKEALLETMRRTDQQIEQDMTGQFRLLMSIRHEHAWMRFRLPYNKNDREDMEYLKGTIYFPLWGKGIFRDTWLKPTREFGEYELTRWNLYDYESYIYHHNIITRQVNVYNNIITGVPENQVSNELGTDFDGTAEALIFGLYIEQVREPTQKDIEELSNELTKNLNLSSGTNLSLSKIRGKGAVSDPFA